MTLRFHNTLTGTVDDFVSQQPGVATLYTCGPTVYDYLHVGNWSAYIYWDILVRALAANNYNVTRVMNITDVGHLTSDADDGQDKLEKGAKREGKTAWEVADFYGQDFMRGMGRLNLIIPQHVTKATDFIPQQLDLVRRLKNRGVTYKIDDGIYFDTSKFPSYADFAHLDLDNLQAGARVDFNPQKRHASDFALWKFTPANETRDMEWPTPADLRENNAKSSRATEAGDGASSSLLEGDVPVQGEPSATGEFSEPPVERPLKGNDEDVQDVHTTAVMGFPGWHLECSAMAMSILGDTLDMHTGGIDHIPVHHTNEIAQSEAATSKQFSRFWLHNNHLKVGGTKISKSLGNGYTLDDLEKRGYSLPSYRLFVLQSHYTTEGNFTFDNLGAASHRLTNWRNVAALRHQILDTLRDDDDKATDDGAISLYATSQAIIEALSDNLDTPRALMIIDEAFSRLSTAAVTRIHRHALIELLDTIDTTLGLQLVETTPDITDDMKRLIIERRLARDARDFARSDAIRDQLAQFHIVIRDTPSGSVWQYNQDA